MQKPSQYHKALAWLLQQTLTSMPKYYLLVDCEQGMAHRSYAKPNLIDLIMVTKLCTKAKHNRVWNVKDYKQDQL